MFILGLLVKISGNITISAVFNVHKSKEKTRHGNSWSICGKIQPQFGIMYVAAMLFAIDKINQNGSFMHGVRLGSKIMDYCGDKTLLVKNLKQLFDSRGLIGPHHSEDAIAAAAVMNHKQLPIISYAATSLELGDRYKYKRFFRTVPSDRLQVKAMIDLAIKFNWTYVLSIYSSGSYGEDAALHFKQKAKEASICIPALLGLPRYIGKSSAKEALTTVVNLPKITAVYLFLKDNQVRKILEAIKDLKHLATNITFIAGDEWGDKLSIVQGLEESANGALTISQHADEVQEFKDYFLALNPKNNKRNAWFSEFWEDVFNCTLPDTKRKANKSCVRCTGKEKLALGRGYYENTPILTVINAVYAYAHVFRKIIEECSVGCNKSVMLCVRKKRSCLQWTNDHTVSKLQKLKFKEPFRNRTFSFDYTGSVAAHYDILNFRQNGQLGYYTYSKVGEWEQMRSPALSINTTNIFWNNRENRPPMSFCSIKCDFGSIVVFKHDSKCCLNCKACGVNDHISNNTCLPCELDYIPDPFRRSCRRLPDKYLGVESSIVQSLLFLMVLGLLSTFATTAIFLKHYSTKIVKTSSRELCLNILLGIMITQIAPVMFIMRPSTVICLLQRVLTGLSFTLCYAPLLLKLNRIYRIFKMANVRVQPPVMVSSRSQLSLSFGLSLISLISGLGSIIEQEPQIIKEYPHHRRYVVLHCEMKLFTIFFSLMYSFTMMLLSAFYAFKTRNFPRNSNETKFIGFTVYATCLILAFVFPSFWFIQDPEGKYKAIILCFTCEAVAAVNLFGLFGQKISLLSRPESLMAKIQRPITLDYFVNSASDIFSTWTLIKGKIKGIIPSQGHLPYSVWLIFIK